MANGRMWYAYCENCEYATDMEKTDTPNEGICVECKTVQKVGQNPRKKKEIQRLELVAQSLHNDYLLTRLQIDKLMRTLDPVEVTPKPKWERLTMEMACRLCERKTRHAFSGIPQCHPKCKPRPGKVSAEDIPEVIAMIREYLGGNNDDDDFEVMKFQTPEAS